MAASGALRELTLGMGPSESVSLWATLLCGPARTPSAPAMMSSSRRDLGTRQPATAGDRTPRLTALGPSAAGPRLVLRRWTRGGAICRTPRRARGDAASSTSCTVKN